MSTTTTTAVITVDLMRPTINTIHVKQFDALSRFADIKIVSGGQPWSAGTSITYVVQYSKPDGTKGMYDKLPDGSTAVTSETDDTGSTVLHVRFAPQMFTVHGNVHCSVAMIKTDGLKLQTFSFCIRVEKSDVNGDTSKDYYKMTTIDALMESIGDLSNLGTAAKESIVAAINEVLSGIPKDYVKSVNNVRPQANGDLLLHASDIDTQLPSTSYQGSVEGALEAILSMPALPITRGISSDGIAYTATGDDLPTVQTGSHDTQTDPVGKGRQIVFIPYGQNASGAPTLQLNGGEVIPIRLRAPSNQGTTDYQPDATLPVPAGALMRGVPYTLTFCGKYWLVDSQIAQFSCVRDEYQAAVMQAMAEVASGMADGDTIGMPIVNSMDGIAGHVSSAFIARSAAEYALPPEDGSVRLPTEQRVDEMIRKNIADAPVMSQRAKDLLITILRSAKYETDQSENITNLQIELGSKYNCVIVNNLIGCTSSNPAIGADRNDGYTTTLTASAGKRLGNVRVKRGNVDITKWVYNPETGIISINKVMDNISVTAECPDTPSEKTVDLVMTMGQSNISGRGQAEKATPCPAGHGYWYKNPNLSAPSQAEEGLYQIVEPYGNEGAQSSGSPVAALASAYYDATGVPMVCVSNSYGGTPISNFISTGAGTKLQKGIDAFNAAKAYLESQGYTIRHKVVLWCQGESDAEIGTTAEEYTAMFNTMKSTLNAECGIEKIAIINIGQYKDSSIDFTTIRDAQFALAANDSDVIMVSDKFRGALMNGGVDSWHYTQSSYDIVGYDAAKNLAHYFITGDKPNVTEYSDADYSEQNVSTYTDFVSADWDYAVVTAGSVLRTYQVSMIDLYQYLGGETTVNVPAYYLHNNIIYSVRVEGRTGTNNSPFYNCTSITDISFDAGVLRTAFGYVRWFYGCKSLKSVSGIPALLDGLSESYTSAGGMYSGCESLPSVVFPKGITYAGSICSGCKSLQSIPEIPTTVTSIIDAFANSGLSHIPNIPNAVTSIARIMNLPGKNHPLTSIGTIGSGVTDMSNAFRYASNLRGTIRIEAKNIASGKMVNAFHADTIANAMFEVPADSTTYETLIATFPDIPADHITTF